ncbi:MAG TPA: hypothetical protein DCF63_20650 [Planctomycetaceae bacterium]|nr:hypothetical protein [Planctomycetaceae bacterium]
MPSVENRRWKLDLITMFLLPWKFEFDTQSGHQSVMAVRVLAKVQGLPLRAIGTAGLSSVTRLVQRFLELMVPTGLLGNRTRRLIQSRYRKGRTLIGIFLSISLIHFIRAMARRFV